MPFWTAKVIPLFRLKLCNNWLACRVRVLPAAADGAGQPNNEGFSWHCSVQVSNASKPLVGLTTCMKNSQARCASAAGSSNLTAAACACVIGGSAAVVGAVISADAMRIAANRNRLLTIAPWHGKTQGRAFHGAQLRYPSGLSI